MANEQITTESIDTSIFAIAQGFGLSLEHSDGMNKRSFRVYKGAKQVFAGTEPAVREFLIGYKTKLPGLYHETTVGYKE